MIPLAIQEIHAVAGGLSTAKPNPVDVPGGSSFLPGGLRGGLLPRLPVPDTPV